MNGRKIGVILGEFFHLPGEYFRDFYNPVIKGFLVQLRNSVLLAPKCRVILPYRDPIPGIEDIFKPLTDDPNLSPALLPANASPLYCATEEWNRQDSSCEGLLVGLKEETPFLRLIMRRQEADEDEEGEEESEGEDEDGMEEDGEGEENGEDEELEEGEEMEEGDEEGEEMEGGGGGD